MSGAYLSAGSMESWQTQTLSRRQSGGSSSGSDASAVAGMSSTTRLHVFIAIGAALGCFVIIGIACGIFLAVRHRRRRNAIHDAEEGKAVSQRVVRRWTGKGGTVLYSVPTRESQETPVSSTSDVYSQPNEHVTHPAPAASRSKHQQRPSGILRRFSAFLDSTVDEPVRRPGETPNATESKVMGTLQFPPLEDHDRFTWTGGDSIKGNISRATRAKHSRSVSSGTLGSNMFAGAVLGSIPRLGRNSDFYDEQPPVLPPLSMVSPFRLPQYRRNTNRDSRSTFNRKRFSMSSAGVAKTPVLWPRRRSMFGSTDLKSVTKHDRNTSMKSIASSQWQNPNGHVARPRSKGGRLSSIRSRPSTRSTHVRSSSDGATRRTGSAGSFETNDSAWNRFSVHRIETANQISIKRLSGAGPGKAGRGVQKLTGPLKRLQPKMVVTANGSPVDRKRTSLVKRLSMILDRSETSPESSRLSRQQQLVEQALYQYNTHEEEATPITPPRQTYVSRFSATLREVPKSSIASSPAKQLSTIHDQVSSLADKSLHSQKAQFVESTTPSSPPPPVSFQSSQIVFNSYLEEDPFYLDQPSASQQVYNDRPSPMTPETYRSSSVQFTNQRIMHGIKEEAESDEEGFEVSLLSSQEIKPQGRPPRAQRTTWTPSSPAPVVSYLDRELNAPPNALARNASVASRQSLRSSAASYLSIPEFPSTPSRFNSSATAKSEVPALPTAEYSDPSTHVRHGHFSSSAPLTNASSYTSLSSPMYLPSSPPVIDRDMSSYTPASPRTLTKTMPPPAAVRPAQRPAAPSGFVNPRSAAGIRAARNAARASPERNSLKTDTRSTAPLPPVPAAKRTSSYTAPDSTIFESGGSSAAKAEAEMEAMQRRINSALAGFGAATENAILVPDSLDEGGEPIIPPKLPELSFDPAPLFASANNTPRTRRMMRSPRR